MKPQRSFETHYESSDKNMLALGHARFKGRAERLDLITNNMIGMKAKAGDKNFTVCDISESGFSYAEKVPVKKNLSFRQVKTKVNQIASSNYGKKVKYICFFEGRPDSGGVEATGTIRNHTVFLVLSDTEITKTITSYLQSKSIRRSHDPNGFFEKLDLLISNSKRMREKGYSDSSLGVVLNTTFQNLVLEIGASEDIFETFYSGYINKPVYVKYGVSIEDNKESATLLKFAQVKDSRFIEREAKTKDKRLDQKLEIIKEINQKYSFKDFVMSLWYNSLQYFHLDPTLELPKIDKAILAKKLKEEMDFFNGHLEKLADPDFIAGDRKGLESYITNGLYWHLIEIDKKYFDRAVIQKEVKHIIRLTYDKCVQNEQELN